MTESDMQSSSTISWDKGLRLDKKTAIVTGSSRGIGAGIALLLAARGANVVINYTSPSSKSAAEEVAKTVNDNDTDARAVVVHADAGDSKGHQALVDAALELSPTKNIDILVHNAGLPGNQMLEDIEEEFYQKQMDLNVKAPIFLTKLAVPHVPRGGRIILISSISARLGFPSQTVYAATKAALEGLVKVWASELGQSKGITANVVAPGPVNTAAMNAHDPSVKAWLDPILAKTPAAARIGEVDDIAPIVGFLASEESRWLTGSVFAANGGLLFE